MRAVRITRTLGMLAVAAMLGGCGLVSSTGGSGTVATESRSVSGFDQVAISGSGKVIIEIGTEEALTIEAEDNLLPLLTSEVRGSRLELGVETGRSIRATRPIIYRVTVFELTAVDISGSGAMTITGLASDDFDVAISGSGTVDLRGTARHVNVAVSGSGNYDGSLFETESADISVSGSGSAIVNATDTVDVGISGSGNVAYLGSPNVTESITGSGSVTAQ